MDERRFGWVPDTPSFKDHKYEAKQTALAPWIDLSATPFQPPIIDQDGTNSCVGHACSSMVHYLRRKLGLDEMQPSRMFAYYFARFVRHNDWHKFDEGAMIRDAMTALTVVGICSEAEWPFNPAHINDRPDVDDVKAAGGHKTLRYVRMLRGANPQQDDLYYLKHSLQSGYPWGFGISVFSSFMDVGSSGVVPMPKSSERFEGGHMMYAVGYDEGSQLFKCANSWGDWGDGGFCYLPFDYFMDSDLSDDMWTLRTMKEATA